MTANGWSQVDLAEIVQAITTGVSVKSHGRTRGLNEIGVLKTSAVTYGIFRPEENKAVLQDELRRVREHPKAGCVLVSRMNTALLVGASAYVPETRKDLVLPDRIWQVHPRPDRVDGRWLQQALSAPGARARLSGIASGTSGSMKNISQEKFLCFSILLPALGEQKKISSILSSVDDAIESTQAVIDQLQVVKKAMMAELLTRGLPGRHTRFKKTEIGDVPEEWEVRTIGELIGACDYGLSAALRGDGDGIPVLRMGNLRDGCVVLDELKYIDPQNVSSDLYLREGDVLFNRTNSADQVGKIGVFLGGVNGPVSFASYLLRLRPSDELINGRWLGAVMNMDFNQTRIRTLATPGVSQVNVNRGKLLALAVPVPPLCEQNEIVSVLEGVVARMQAELACRRGLESFKSSLISVLLTGEVRVKPDEETP